eukprot:TRINITY_DN12841_c0_g1_i1.p2 TRINITY_DN12841_c0_g1~~TRINITY_DN12841_c0_g1_i1.p2  ORF type:complete len:102 (+),score=44.09 TRINITY_DN12841_c0_g1_i1:142-447(+)
MCIRDSINAEYGGFLDLEMGCATGEEERDRSEAQKEREEGRKQILEAKAAQRDLEAIVAAAKRRRKEEEAQEKMLAQGAYQVGRTCNPKLVLVTRGHWLDP